MGRSFKIILQPITFRKMDHIALLCPENPLVDEVVREFEDAEWSTGYHFWHLPVKKETVENLANALKQVGTVNKSAFKNFKFPEEQEIKVKTRSKKTAKPTPEQEDKLDSFCVFCKEEGYADGTVKVYRSLLGVFFGKYQSKKDTEITRKDIEDFIYEYIDGNNLTPNYRRLMINTLRRYFMFIGKTEFSDIINI